MTLIVAIEPDRRQATYLSAMVRGRLKAELVLAESAEEALRMLGSRVPDVILTSALLSPKDEAAIAEWLRALDAAAAHVQTLTIPMFASRPRPQQRVRGMFSAFMGSDEEEPAGSPDGCDPAMFAEQCADYLERARAERATHGDLIAPDEVQEPEEDKAEVLQQEVPARVESRHVVAAASAAPSSHPPAEFAEFDLSGFFNAVKNEPLDPPAVEHYAVAERVAEPMDQTIDEPDEVEEPPSAPASDIWVQPRIEVKRVWPPVEIADTSVRSAAPNPQPPARQAPARPAPARRVPRALRPVQDEWGFFDPDQAGFTALLAKLREITESDDPPSKRPA